MWSRPDIYGLLRKQPADTASSGVPGPNHNQTASERVRETH